MDGGACPLLFISWFRLRAAIVALPPIYRDYRRPYLHNKQVLRRSGRHQKRILCTDLRRQSYTAMRRVDLTMHDRAKVALLVRALASGVGAYKLAMQLAIDAGGFGQGNVRLDPLDQFMRHNLKILAYGRYVDDLTLLGDSDELLRQWQREIERFACYEPHLAFKQDAALRPCVEDINFTGYVAFTHHHCVIQPVVNRRPARLQAWHRHCGQAQRRDELTPADFAQLQAMLGSHSGHFSHADSARLRRRLFSRRTWGGSLFERAQVVSLKVLAPVSRQPHLRRLREILKPEGEQP